MNRIRELPQNTKIVATHTDSPDVRILTYLSLVIKSNKWNLLFDSCFSIIKKLQVLIWDVEAQPNRHAVFGATNSRPDLV